MNRDQTSYLVLCSSETPPTEDIGLKEIDSRDRKRGWFRCVHHFVIRRDGTIEHGFRKHTESAMGLRQYNPVSVSICIIGGKGEPVIEKAQIHSVDALIRELLDDYPGVAVVDESYLNPKAPHVGLASYFKQFNKDTMKYED